MLQPFAGFNLWNTNEHKVPLCNNIPKEDFDWFTFQDFAKYKLDKKYPLAFRTGLQVRSGQF